MSQQVASKSQKLCLAKFKWGTELTIDLDQKEGLPDDFAEQLEGVLSEIRRIGKTPRSIRIVTS